MAGGIGKYTAELIAFGETDIQLWPCDVRRFVKLHNNRKFLRDRVKETVGKQYSLKYPTYGSKSFEFYYLTNSKSYYFVSYKWVCIKQADN